MKAIDKIIEDLQLQDIKRLGGKLNKDILITKPLSNSKLEYLYDKDGKLLYKRKIKNGKEEFNNSYLYNESDTDSSTIYETTKKCNHVNKFDIFTSNIITTNTYIKDGKEILSIHEYKTNPKTKRKMAYKTFYDYQKLNGLNILSVIDSSDIYDTNGNEAIIQRLLQLDKVDITNITNNKTCMTLIYSYPDMKATVKINIINNKITDMKYITDDNIVRSKINIKYDKDGFLSEIKETIVTHLNWEYTTITKYDYQNMMIVEERTRAKKVK